METYRLSGLAAHILQREEGSVWGHLPTYLGIPMASDTGLLWWEQNAPGRAG
jgi:hypothetical protein